MDPTTNPATPAPDAVRYDPSAGTGGFLVTARPSLWFTPRHILARIQPPEEPPFFLANPPFSAPAGRP
jgi:hypothetical protein